MTYEIENGDPLFQISKGLRDTIGDIMEIHMIKDLNSVQARMCYVHVSSEKGMIVMHPFRRGLLYRSCAILFDLLESVSLSLQMHLKVELYCCG